MASPPSKPSTLGDPARPAGTGPPGTSTGRSSPVAIFLPGSLGGELGYCHSGGKPERLVGVGSKPRAPHPRPAARDLLGLQVPNQVEDLRDGRQPVWWGLLGHRPVPLPEPSGLGRGLRPRRCAPHADMLDTRVHHTHTYAHVPPHSTYVPHTGMLLQIRARIPCTITRTHEHTCQGQGCYAHMRHPTTNTHVHAWTPASRRQEPRVAHSDVCRHTLQPAATQPSTQRCMSPGQMHGPPHMRAAAPGPLAQPSPAPPTQGQAQRHPVASPGVPSSGRGGLDSQLVGKPGWLYAPYTKGGGGWGVPKATSASRMWAGIQCTAGEYSLGSSRVLATSVQVPGPASESGWPHGSTSVPAGPHEHTRARSSSLPVCPPGACPALLWPLLTVPLCTPLAGTACSHVSPVPCVCQLPISASTPSMSLPARPVSRLCPWGCLMFQACSSSLHPSPRAAVPRTVHPRKSPLPGALRP